MGDKTKIEWADASWTPIRARDLTTGAVGWHCEHASEGCRNCYAEGMNARLGTKLAFKPGHRADLQIFLDEDMLQQPLRWKKPRKIFVCSMTDLFASFVPADFVDRIFRIAALCPQHTFQILTKRADRMRSYMNAPDRGQPLDNVWLGVSVEDQANAEERIPQLLATPAWVRFLSCEPMVGAIDLDRIRAPKGATYFGSEDLPALWARGPGQDDRLLHWVICGGESGRQARAMYPAWARQLRDHCAEAGVPFHFKQWGEFAPSRISMDEMARSQKPVRPGEVFFPHDDDTMTALLRVGKKAAGRELDGVEHDGFPE